MADPRKSAVRFRERSELLDFLLEVVGVTSETLDLDRLLASVSTIVKKVIDCEFFAILLFNERTQSLRIRHSVGHRPELIDHLEIKLDEGITGAAARSREAVLVGDVRKDPRYLKAVDAVRTELAVPMMARQKLVGVLDVQSTRANAYTEYDRALLRLIASRVAFAVENARLYRRVERTNRTLSTFAEIANEISSILDLDELLGRISTLMRRVIQYDAFSIFLLDDEHHLLRHRFSIRHDRRVDIQSIPLDKGISGAAARSREPVRVDDTENDSRYIASHPGVRSEVAVPLMVSDRVVGVMDLESDRIAYFTDTHVRVLSTVAPQIASSIENARLYGEVAIRQRQIEGDLVAAKRLMGALLPTEPPPMLDLEVAAKLVPARIISGDIYDFFEHGDSQTAMAFGDVSGKGVAAALYGTLVGGLLRTLAPRRRSPSILLRALNDALVERRVDARYVALLVLLWDPFGREFRIANAGALPPMLVRNGVASTVNAAGVPLGLLPGREYEELSLNAEPGDLLVLYSDGITDHTNEQDQDYGGERLAALLPGITHLPPKEIIAAILEDLDRFGGAGLSDDRTLLVLKIH
ncbi:MAG: SpoIIE family protein phosphatase [Bryobacteraceae bacterium]